MAEIIELTLNQGEAQGLVLDEAEPVELSLLSADVIELHDDGGEVILLTAGDPETVVIEAVEDVVELTVVDPEVVTLTVLGETGPKGPPGDRGPAGPPGLPGDSAIFRWHQAAASSVWVIPHMLGFYPAVTTTDTAGTQVFGDVSYLDESTVEITFGLAFAGYANFS